LWKINCEQAVHSMIEKGDPLARFGRAADEIFEEWSRQATPERFAPGGIDAQSVALQTIRRRIVTLEELDAAVVQLQPLRQTQATGACANDHHLERLASHDSSAPSLLSSSRLRESLPYLKG
jgi:hypothetical protein